MVFGCFFIINLFVGLIISAYNREMEKSDNSFIMTEQQKEWIQTKMLVLKLHPRLATIRPVNNKLRAWFYDIAVSKYFEYFILVAITLNTLVMCLKWPN
jgi:hypothetical protein